MAGTQPPTMTRAELRLALEEHHQSAYGWALQCCGRHPDEAEDVLQTVYLKVLNGKARFRGDAAFRTWLFALIRITAADFRRSWLRRLRRQAWLDPPVPVREPGAEESLSAAQQATQLQNALALLPARQRQVLHLAFYQDLSLREVAEVLGISLGSVRTHYERGKARLRALLQDVEAPRE